RASNSRLRLRLRPYLHSPSSLRYFQPTLVLMASSPSSSASAFGAHTRPRLLPFAPSPFPRRLKALLSPRVSIACRGILISIAIIGSCGDRKYLEAQDGLSSRGHTRAVWWPDEAEKGERRRAGRRAVRVGDGVWSRREEEIYERRGKLPVEREVEVEEDVWEEEKVWVEAVGVGTWEEKNAELAEPRILIIQHSVGAMQDMAVTY
ncbi:hypothetical protein R3P38DRAFT_2818546, partial [Favolaschia claudopus]